MLVRLLSGVGGILLSATRAWRVHAAEIKDKDLELVQVQVITRHGARTPLLPSAGTVDEMFNGMNPYVWECESFQETDPTLYLRPEGEADISYDDYKKKSLHSYEKPKIFGTCVDAQLTLEGMKQSWEFGQLLRERYVNLAKFLPSTYNPETFWIRSSNTSRTILTARQVMRGFYPPENRPSDAKVTINMAVSETLYPCNCDKFLALKKKNT